MQKTGDHKRFYARRGLVTRPVHLTPEEAAVIRRAAWEAGVSQQVYMRVRLADVLTPSEIAERLAALATA